MTIRHYIISKPKPKELLTLILQFNELVKGPNSEDKDNYLAIMKKVFPERLKQSVEELSKVKFEDKFKDDISKPTNKLIGDFDMKVKSGHIGDKELENLLVDLENILKKMEIYINELYKSFRDPTRRLSQLTEKEDIESIEIDEERIFNNFKNSYDYFINEYRKFILIYEINRGYKPEYLRIFKDVSKMKNR